MEYYEIVPGVGERINQLREQEDETVVALAKAIGVSSSYMSRLLQDKKAWQIEQIRDAAKHYGVSPEYICKGDLAKFKDLDGIDYKAILGDAIVHLKLLPAEERNQIGAWAMKRIIDVTLNFSE